MSTISVDYDVLNQKGSPAWFSDTFANIPTFGYKGRMFISIDTFAFYRDTGTGWDLIGGPGIGTLTGSGVTGQVSFFNGTQVLTGNNNLFWDNTNSRLGINTATPGAPLDIHGTGTQLQLNGTAANNSYLVFQNSGASKWRIGNLSPANSFEIYNAATSSYALTITSATNEVVIGQKLTISGIVTFGSTLSNNTYFYTLPSATGTLALTSNLSSYLPLAGGTLTGALIGTTALFSGNLEAGRIGGSVTIGDLFVDSANNSVYVGRQSSTSGDNSKFYVRNRLNTLTALSVDPGGNGSVDVVGTFSTTRGANLATSTGNVLIGTNTDNGQKLQVAGQIQASGSVNLNISSTTFNTGTTTIFTITSEANSHYLVTGHDPNTSTLYASAIVIVNGTGGVTSVINIASLGGLSWTGTGTSVQMINAGAAANGRSSIIRMR